MASRPLGKGSKRSGRGSPDSSSGTVLTEEHLRAAYETIVANSGQPYCMPWWMGYLERSVRFVSEEASPEVEE
jgi:hypothetical protein